MHFQLWKVVWENSHHSFNRHIALSVHTHPTTTTISTHTYLLKKHHYFNTHIPPSQQTTQAQHCLWFISAGLIHMFIYGLVFHYCTTTTCSVFFGSLYVHSFVTVLFFISRYIFDGSSLIVSNAEPKDEGVYTCEVITKLDTANASGSITVVGTEISDYSYRKDQGLSQVYLVLLIVCG